MAVNDSTTASFCEDGFLFPITVHGTGQVAEVRAQWEEFERTVGLKSGSEELGFNRHTDQDWIWRIASNELILDALEPLIGNDIVLFGSRISCKWPGDGSTFAWHQDVSPHKKMSPPKQITVWYAIDSADLTNGCVRCIPGSHRDGMLARIDSDIPGNVLRRNEENHVSEELARHAVPVILEPGQVSLHDGFTLHSSKPNLSKQRRCGLVLRYVPSAVRQAPDVDFDQRSTAIPVRGYDDFLGIDATEAAARLDRALSVQRDRLSGQSRNRMQSALS